jgi:hypothetical protein
MDVSLGIGIDKAKDGQEGTVISDDAGSSMFIPSNANCVGNRFKLWLEVLPLTAAENSGWIDLSPIIKQ